jgi:hypothetical protein
MPMTPPVAAHACICSSVTLRSWRFRPIGDECENTTGVVERSKGSMVVR